MAFVLDPHQPLQAALIEAARAECACAEAAFLEPTPPHVHAGRKSIKRLRAWLRLLRPQLGERYALIDRLLRDSALQLGGRRDADVARETLLGLRRARQLDAAQYAALQPMLRAAPPRDAQHDSCAEQRALSLLRATATYIDTLSLPAIDEATLRAGLEKVRLRCRREYRRARRKPDAEALHDWRKWVKHLGTLVQLLGSRLGDCGSDAGALKDLADALGRHHDLVQLLHRLEAAGLGQQPLLHLRLRDAVARRQQTLEQRVLRRGALLLR
jgi:CHAD domain-containing protein